MQSRDPDVPARSRIDTPLASTGAGLRADIHEVVNDVSDKTGAPVSRTLVAQIAEEVFDRLKARDLTGDGATPTGPTGQPTPASSQTLPSRSASTLKQHRGSQPTSSGDPRYASAPLHHPAPTATRPAMPASPTSPIAATLPPQYTPPSPDRSSRGSNSNSPELPPSESESFSKGSRRDSKSSMSGTDDGHVPKQRQRPVRIPSAVEETSLEKAWGPLFDNGKPTERLGQFLRGIAKHLIEDCKPRNSIVLTPGKLSDFFEATRMPHELYTWRTLFGGELRNDEIATIFVQLRCEFHLVQFSPEGFPTIPGLTPQGFEKFMTMNILASPDLEASRLDKAVKNMPISNADKPSERFPKQLPRRLFPASSDGLIAQRLQTVATSKVQTGIASNLPPPPPSHPPSMGGPSAASAQSSFSERDRSTHSSANMTSAIDDDDLRATSSTPFPIERERKPYTAKEGSGKIHEEARGIANGIRNDPGPRSARANSTIPAQAPPFMQASRPTDIPNSVPRSHRMSMNAVPSARFATSPAYSMNNPYTRSEGTNVADIPYSQYASNMDQEEPHYRDPRRSLRRQPTEDEYSRTYGSTPRGGFDYGSPHNFSSRTHSNSDGHGGYPPHIQQPPLPHNQRY